MRFIGQEEDRLEKRLVERMAISENHEVCSRVCLLEYTSWNQLDRGRAGRASGSLHTVWRISW